MNYLKDIIINIDDAPVVLKRPLLPVTQNTFSIPLFVKYKPSDSAWPGYSWYNEDDFEVDAILINGSRFPEDTVNDIPRVDFFKIQKSTNETLIIIGFDAEKLWQYERIEVIAVNNLTYSMFGTKGSYSNPNPPMVLSVPDIHIKADALKYSRMSFERVAIDLIKDKQKIQMYGGDLVVKARFNNEADRTIGKYVLDKITCSQDKARVEGIDYRFLFNKKFPTGWIYKAPNNSNFVFRTGSENRPEYSQYLHGWYHPNNGERAVMFIDSALPPGQRCIIMDSPNSMFEYDHRVPSGSDSEGRLIFPLKKSQEAWSKEIPLTLGPGKYRFELRGGKGGNGGNLGSSKSVPWLFPMMGWKGTVLTPMSEGGEAGVGAESVPLTYKLVSHNTINIIIYRGADGENGEDADGGSDRAGPDENNAYHYTSAMVGGGGGSSGEDSFIKVNGGILAQSRGGAGGGGATAIVKWSDTEYVNAKSMGGGGGGAGSRAGSGARGDGGLSYIPNDSIYQIRIDPAKGGGSVNGGAGSLGSIGRASYKPYEPGTVYAGDESTRGESGQNLSVGIRRNGGNTKENYQPLISSRPFQAKGGNKALDESNGYVEIYKYE